MRSLILALGEMAKLEQERAAEVHPPFASAHEGFAHIQEETEEAKAELDYIEVQTGLLWGEIKRKGIGLEDVDRYPQNHSQPFAGEHIVFCDVVVTHYILFLSAISAIFASFSRVSPLTRE